MMILMRKLKRRTTVFVFLLFIALSTRFHSAQNSGTDSAGFDPFKSSIFQVYCNRFPYALCSNGSTEPWESSNYLLGAPNMRYKDNLRNDTYYVTSWGNGGFTNQFMSYVNMIYLGTISDRIPIVPPFAPDHHISPNAGPLPFGEVFDLPQLRRALCHPILEWSEVKAVASRLSMDLPAVVEELGCWSSRSSHEDHPIRAIQLLRHLGLDVSYTRVPSRVRYLPQLDTNPHVSFFPLAETIFPANPADHPGDNSIMEASPLGARLGPDVHIACFDYLYFTTAGTQEFEWKTPWSPAWRFIGRHLHFTESLMELSKAYVRRALKVKADELPPFITVHARRGDFEHQCWDDPTDCLAPLSAFSRRVQEVQAALFQKHGLHISEILLTSDEKDPSFWNEVTAQGWKYIDHVAERTLIQYGEWYLPLIDIVAQSLGAGFVGSIDSTVSIVSARRVEDWNHGVTRIVGWGGRD